MSKIGRLNFSLQEVAEELGYDTVSEAMEDGYSMKDLRVMRGGVYGN